MGISNTAGTLAGRETVAEASSWPLLPLQNRALASFSFAGVVGVAATGWMIEHAGLGLRGWWQAFSTAAALCMSGSVVFLACAQGDRIFGDTDQF